MGAESDGDVRSIHTARLATEAFCDIGRDRRCRASQLTSNLKALGRWQVRRRPVDLFRQLHASLPGQQIVKTCNLCHRDTLQILQSLLIRPPVFAEVLL